MLFCRESLGLPPKPLDILPIPIYILPHPRRCWRLTCHSQGLAPFLNRCRAEGLALVLLLDECFEKLPVEACSALDGVKEVTRDVSLHILRHR